MLMDKDKSKQEFEVQYMETPIREENIYDGQILHVRRLIVRLEDGREAVREVVRHPGASAVVVIDDHGDIVLEKQYRAAVGHFMLEIPAGKLDEGEDPLSCAKRELKEETGLIATQWQKMGVYVTSPGFCDEAIHLFLARENGQGETNLDDGEIIEIVRMPLSEAVDLVMNGEIADGKSISGILMADRLLR